MSVIPAMTALLERQKTTPSLSFPDEEKPTRKGAFKVSSKLLKMWKDEVGKDGPHMLLFKKVRDAIAAIPREDLPKIWGKDNMADAQDIIAMKPKLAFQLWMRNVKKVSPKMQKYIQAVAENVPLVYYGFMVRVSGKDMADTIFKRHFETESSHPGELKRKKKWDEKKALRKALKKQGIATEAKAAAPNWKKAAEKLMKTIKGKDQESFQKRAYLRAVIQGNQAQATHMAKNMLDPKAAKDLRMKLIDLAGMKEEVSPLSEGPTSAQWNKAEKVAEDPASGATYWNVGGTVWLRSMHSPKGVNQGSYEDFMKKFKAGKYASRIKLIKKESSMIPGLPKDWKRIAGIENTHRGFEDVLREESDYDQIKAYLDKEMTPIKTKGIRASWWIPGKAWALNLPFQGAQIHTFTILPLFPGKKAYRAADPDRAIPEGIIINPAWRGVKDFDRTMAQIEKAVDLIKHKAPSLEDEVDKDIKWIEQKFGVKVPNTVVARIKKGLTAMAKRRWDVNMLRQYGQLYPFDGGKPFKLDSWGSLKR